MIKPYKKDYDYSYTLGFYPSFELVKYHKEAIQKVLIAEEALSSDGYFKLKSMLEDIPFLTNEKEFRKIAEKDNDHVAVIFKKYQEKLDENNPHVVLVNPSDQGNLGNIMRSMAAFSFKDLAIITPAADRYNPKVIRSSMGSAFFVRQQTFSSFEEYLKAYPRKFYPFMLQTNRGLKSLELKESKYALVFGNEARGLDRSFLNENAIKIEQLGEVDSLNLPTAVAIALYEAGLKRS